MKPLEDIYKGSFFKNRHKLSWRVPHVCNAIFKVLMPTTIIDVGCGIGDYVKGFEDKGVLSYGLEGSLNSIPFLVDEGSIFIKDLREPLNLDFEFDLVMCFEVLEHIEPEYADMLVSNLTGLSDRVLVSAAPPGQGGHYHVNCQTRSYWIKRFQDKGYQYCPVIENAIRKEWTPVKHKKEMSAYYNNLLYFEKKVV